MKRQGKLKYELILFFERFHFTPKVAFEKLKKHGYARTTIYRYYRIWSEADTEVKVLQRDL
jgi:hypothetical protein